MPITTAGQRGDARQAQYTYIFSAHNNGNQAQLYSFQSTLYSLVLRIFKKLQLFSGSSDSLYQRSCEEGSPKKFVILQQLFCGDSLELQLKRFSQEKHLRLCIVPYKIYYPTKQSKLFLDYRQDRFWNIVKALLRSVESPRGFFNFGEPRGGLFIMSNVKTRNDIVFAVFFPSSYFLEPTCNFVSTQNRLCCNPGPYENLRLLLLC